MSYKYIDKEKDLVGKTISKIVPSSEKLYLIFEDQSWTALQSGLDYDGYSLAPEPLHKSRIDHNDYYAARLIDEVEYHKRGEKFIKAAARKYLENEKRQYERLKAKFEK